MHEKQLMEAVLNYLKRNGPTTVFEALKDSLSEAEAKEYASEIEYALDRKDLIDLRAHASGRMIAEITTKGKMYLDE
ncbi:MAG TPA: hypothetical protein PKW56_03155 [Clostridiales bacterium]|nr:hypothetical protein [Clostridiales bacterium]